MVTRWTGLGVSILLLIMSGQSSPVIQHKWSMKEAVHLGLTRAKAWDSRAALISATSVDDRETEWNKGRDGRRSDWNLIYGVPNTDKSLIVSIRKHQIQEKEIRDTFYAEDSIQICEIVVNSPELVRKAIKKYHLKPGITWAEGYHFILFKSKGTPFFAVVGRDQENRHTKIYFHPKDGQYQGMSISK